MKRKDAPWVLHKGEVVPELTTKRSKRYYMPMRTIEDDEKELRLPRTDDGETHCALGPRCVSVADIIGGPGAPIKGMVAGGACLLCQRSSMRERHVRHTILEETIRSNRLVQRWESPVGPGGYRESCCITRSQKKYNGFVSSVAIGNANDYAWVCNPSTGEWTVDQKLMYADFQKAPSHKAQDQDQDQDATPRREASDEAPRDGALSDLSEE